MPASKSRQLIEALRNPACYPHPVRRVHLLETHISWVLLAGRYAYKIKKPVDFGFLDFSRLERRRLFCQEELRLNRRLAPRLYLDVVSVGGSHAQPVLDAQPAIEYGVKMRRFAASRLMDVMLREGRCEGRHIDLLAGTVAGFHQQLAPSGPDQPYGSPEAIETPARMNFEQLAGLLQGEERERLGRLREASDALFQSTRALFERRRAQGFVRECHGDLHLGNIVLQRGRPVPFDCIEFDPMLRWNDVMSEVAFLVMDLWQRGRPDLGFRFLNGYLEITGDYGGLGTLPFYLTYRTMVRAKIAALRAAQSGAAQDWQDCRSYLALAGTCGAPRRPALMITHGLPGSGKSAVSLLALERLHAIRLRSDVERKRLFGLSALEKSHGRVAGGIYGADASRRTYAHLLATAHQLLADGEAVILDAAFLRRSERDQCRALAAELGVPFAILSVQAHTPLLQQRIRQRMRHGRDASEADLAVLDQLAAVQEPLQEEESRYCVEFRNEGAPEAIAGMHGAWRRLQELLAGN